MNEIDIQNSLRRCQELARETVRDELNRLKELNARLSEITLAIAEEKLGDIAFTDMKSFYIDLKAICETYGLLFMERPPEFPAA